MALPSLKQIWDLGRRIEDLFTLQAENKTTFGEIDERFRALEAKLAERLRAVEDRLLKLESEQTQVISDAKTAASAAAMMISNAALSETVTRLTRVEMGVERIEQGRLPPPAQ